jgi:glycosyltransferase involved in cell wall biosynthesis
MSQGISFSIIIPTYNRAILIKDTLESIFAQTYPHYEVVVVDNCSTDNTQETLQPLIDSGKIRFIKHERNYERARSRNTGMENARGDFATFLDSDDFMYPNNLADAAKFAERNPDLKCFHNLYELIDNNQKVVYRYEFPPLGDRIKAIAKGNFMSCIGNFIHRDIYTKYRFDTFADLTGVEDWDFWLRVLADYDLGRIEKMNSGVLHHENRTVNNSAIEVLESGCHHLFKKFRQDTHLSKIYKNYLNRIEASSYMYLAVLSNSSGLFEEAKHYLKLAKQKDWRIIFTSRYLRISRHSYFAIPN